MFASQQANKLSYYQVGGNRQCVALNRFESGGARFIGGQRGGVGGCEATTKDPPGVFAGRLVFRMMSSRERWRSFSSFSRTACASYSVIVLWMAPTISEAIAASRSETKSFSSSIWPAAPLFAHSMAASPSPPARRCSQRLYEADRCRRPEEQQLRLNETPHTSGLLRGRC